jgi:hypothetical protein
MASGGTIRKLVVNGITRTLSQDNDPKFTIGGIYATEKQNTNNDPFFLYDTISGALTGIEERVGHSDGSLDSLETAIAACLPENNGYVSALITVADGTKYTASGGAVIVIDGAADGMTSLREGKVTYALHPKKGKWIKA